MLPHSSRAKSKFDHSFTPSIRHDARYFSRFFDVTNKIEKKKLLSLNSSHVMIHE